MAMAHAVEGRFPFLDHRLVEFAARIPPRLKLKGLREKHILREAIDGPAAARRSATAPKQPYRAPDSQSFVGADAPAYVGERLSAAARSRAAGYFDPRAVAEARREVPQPAVVGFRDNMAFVGILSTQLWHRAFVQRRKRVAPQPPDAVA